MEARRTLKQLIVAPVKDTRDVTWSRSRRVSMKHSYLNDISKVVSMIKFCVVQVGP